jgi:hypothetical protein
VAEAATSAHDASAAATRTGRRRRLINGIKRATGSCDAVPRSHEPVPAGRGG